MPPRINSLLERPQENCEKGTAIQVEHDGIVITWLHEGPFQRILTHLGYQQTATYGKPETVRIQFGDVLVWYTEGGISIHAAFALSPDTLFNKMGQSWSQPWLLVPLFDVVEFNDSLTGGGHVAVYRRG